MHLKIISSTKKIFEGEVDEVYAPSTAGEMGILKNHENLVASLDIGGLKLKKDGKVDEYLLNGGFIQIENNNIVILADDVHAAKELIKSEIDEAISLATKKMATKLPPTELIKLEKQLRYEKLKKSYIE